MKVILYKDVNHFGEEGDVKVVANGYARNFLFPRHLAVPYTEETVAYFESRKAEIEARKELKRKNSATQKEKLEALNLVAVMPAGTNGKLYGAVTTQTISDLLHKEGFEIERKRIELPGLTIKSTGNYHFTIKLYESQIAGMNIAVKSQSEKNVKSEETTVPEKAEHAKPTESVSKEMEEKNETEA